MSSERKYTNRVLYRRVLAEVRPFRAHIAALLLIGLLAAPLTLLNPIPLKLIVDSVLGTHELPPVISAFLPRGSNRDSVAAIALLAALFVLIALVKQLADFGASILRTYTGEKLVLSFRARLFRHVQELSLSYHDARGTADSTYRIQYDAPAIQWIALDAVIPLVTEVVTLVAMIVVMARLDWTLALIAIAVVPALVVVSQKYSHRLKVRWREVKDLESSTFGVVREVLSSVRLVKAFAQEDREQKRYVDHASRNAREQVRLAVTGGLFSVSVGMIMAIGMAAVLFFGARHVSAGQLTLGEFILVMSYVTLLYVPLQNLSRAAASLQGSLVSFERTIKILDEVPEVDERPHAQPLQRARGDVTFNNVSFAYDGGRAALNGVSFKVTAGARVGIAGPTGAGKSTLVSLLLRLYDPTVGQILLDNTDLRDFKLPDLRNQFAIVLQDPLLFSTTIAENIAYGKPDASEEEIVAAAKAANAHDFISLLPAGYRTEVGERGVALSGGERQRISLARAFLKDAAMLILDEPTSSVDVTTEAAILQGMERLMRGRTTFMIAHRINTLDSCDVRLQLDQGKLMTLSA